MCTLILIKQCQCSLEVCSELKCMIWEGKRFNISQQSQINKCHYKCGNLTIAFPFRVGGNWKCLSLTKERSKYTYGGSSET